MKYIIIIFLILLFFGNKLILFPITNVDICAVNTSILQYVNEYYITTETENTIIFNKDLIDKDKRVIESKEGQVIKTLFDGIKSNELKSEKFVAIISCQGGYFYHLDIREAYLVAWFKYSNKEHYVTVSYFSFPKYEFFKEMFLGTFPDQTNGQLYVKKMNQFSIFLHKIIHNKKIINIKKNKQLKLPLPIGLRNDEMFNKMFKIYKRPPVIINGVPAVIARTDGGYSYYWGIKSDKIELVRHNYDSYENNIALREQIERDILSPIIKAILEHETPEHWKEDYRKYKEAQNKKHIEAQKSQNKKNNGD